MKSPVDEIALPSKSSPPLVAPRRLEWHWLLVLLFGGVAVSLLLTVAAGGGETLALLRAASPFYVLLVIVTQMLRYAAIAFSTYVVIQIFGAHIQYVPLLEVTFAAQAANRTFVGGAAGLLIRGAFFLKQGLHVGIFAAVELIEDIVSVAAISLLFLTGLAIVLATGNAGQLNPTIVLGYLFGVLLLVVGVVWLLRQRAVVERLVEATAQILDAFSQRILRRRIYDRARVDAGVDDFYSGMGLARRDPPRVLIAFLCALVRLGCDAAGLYFAFLAVGVQVQPALVLIIFVASSSISTIAAVPGQIGVMETSLTLLSTSLGIPPAGAVSAALLFRAISFWLPIPLGYASAWWLGKRDLI